MGNARGLTSAVARVYGLGALGVCLSALLRAHPARLLLTGAVVLGAAGIVSREVRLLARGPLVKGLREAYPPGSDWAPTAR